MDELLEFAAQKRLHQDRYWEVLVHYKPAGRGMESLVDDPRFFLSPDGKTDPEEEIKATIKALFRTDVKDDEHPKCRFIARYTYLKEALSIDETRLPAIECKKFNEAMENVKPRRAVLIFAASHINSPASMFGHTLVRIDSERETKLLSHAVNYAALATDTNGIIYAFKGIFGYYKGFFSILPYYEKVREYNDIDQRDMWEYELNFTEEEVLRMAMHIWELQEIYSYYFFFNENCSYTLLFLLEAGRPSLRLTDGFSVYAVPVDTIRIVKQSGAIEKREYRASLATRIKHIADQIDEDKKDVAVKIANGELKPEDIAKSDMEKEEKIKILSLSAQYIQHRYSKKKLSKEDYQRLFLGVLKQRGSLGAVSDDKPPEDKLYSIAPPPPPEGGHLTKRLGMGFGIKDDGKKETDFFELKMRPAYHGLLDPEEGFVEGSGLEFLNGVLRYYPSEEKMELEGFDLVNITSFSPRDRFFKPISWKVKTGIYQRLFDKGKDHAVYGLNAGGGVTQKHESLGIYYITMEGDLNISKRFEDDFTLGAGAGAGFIKKLSDSWKVGVSAKAIYYEIGDEHRRYEVSLSQRFKIAPNNTISVDVSRGKTFGALRSEVKIGWNVFF